MYKEPEFDGRHTIANKHSVIIGVMRFHFLEFLAPFFIYSGDVCIANANGYTTILDYPVYQFAHLFIGLVSEKPGFTVVAVSF